MTVRLGRGPSVVDMACISSEVHRSMYEMMVRIRKVSEKIAELYPEQEMRCPVHLSIGQEAVAAGVGAALRPDDHLYASHRCHGPYLAKGGAPFRLIAELYGKVTGCSRGKGGSMHLVDPAVNMMGSSSIVGGSLPLAVGSALSFALRGTDQVAAVFFGDGAVEEGIFHESLNFASLRKLPVLFVCENNFYAVQSHVSARQPGDNVYQHAEAHLMPGIRIDGNDVVAVHVAAREAVTRARAGAGPTLLECRTYRLREHVGPNRDHDLGYRPREEVEDWERRCPIRSHADALRHSGVLSGPEMAEIDERLEDEICFAAAVAKESPYPQDEEVVSHVY